MYLSMSRCNCDMWRLRANYSNQTRRLVKAPKMVAKCKGKWTPKKFPKHSGFRNWSCEQKLPRNFIHQNDGILPQNVFLSKENKNKTAPAPHLGSEISGSFWWWYSWWMNFPWFTNTTTIGNSWSSWNVTRYFLSVHILPNNSWSPYCLKHYVFGRWRLRSTQPVIRTTPPDLMFHWGLWWRTTFFLAMMNSTVGIGISWWFRNPANTSWGKGSLSVIIYDGF